jgi:2-iminobutanoate/2-iminopropanoate deaminase
MKVEFISSEKLPKSHGPYSHGTKCGNLIFTSGQIPDDPETGKMITDIRAATKMVLSNLLSVVEAGGGRLDTVVKVEVYLKDQNDFNAFNAVYTEFFAGHKPCRVTIQAGDLWGGAPLEAAMTAFVAE